MSNENIIITDIKTHENEINENLDKSTFTLLTEILENSNRIISIFMEQKRYDLISNFSNSVNNIKDLVNNAIDNNNKTKILLKQMEEQANTSQIKSWDESLKKLKLKKKKR